MNCNGKGFKGQWCHCHQFGIACASAHRKMNTSVRLEGRQTIMTEGQGRKERTGTHVERRRRKDEQGVNGKGGCGPLARTLSRHLADLMADGQVYALDGRSQQNQHQHGGNMYSCETMWMGTTLKLPLTWRTGERQSSTHKNMTMLFKWKTKMRR